MRHIWCSRRLGDKAFGELAKRLRGLNGYRLLYLVHDKRVVVTVIAAKPETGTEEVKPHCKRDQVQFPTGDQ